jgi:ferredoxin-NADP reductase
VVADRLPTLLGQPVMVENKPGAGGRLAADAVLAAPADGLTYMIAPNATPTFQMLVFGHQVKWNILRDFTAVAGIASYPLGMGVSLASGASNAKEFFAWARANPDKAAFGTPGLGGQNHFLGVQLSKAAGVELRVTPYKGSPPMVTDLLGGHVSAAISLLDAMMTHHRAGKIRVIGVFSEQRSPLMPDIPDLRRTGHPGDQRRSLDRRLDPRRRTRRHGGPGARGHLPRPADAGGQGHLDAEALGQPPLPQRGRAGGRAARRAGALGTHHQVLRLQTRMTTPLLTLRVRSLTWEAEGILGIELVPLQPNTLLPAFEAGAHIDLHLPDAGSGAHIRSYSLLNAPGERQRYCVAVNLDAASRGGSRWIHEQLRCGQTLAVGAPRNNFPLDEAAPLSIFFAGGIGVTPILGMIRRLEAIGRPWRLHHATRSAAHAPYVRELQALSEAAQAAGRDGALNLHCRRRTRPGAGHRRPHRHAARRQPRLLLRPAGHAGRLRGGHRHPAT